MGQPRWSSHSADRHYTYQVLRIAIERGRDEGESDSQSVLLRRDVSQEAAEKGHSRDGYAHLPFPVLEVFAAKRQDHGAGEDAEALHCREEVDDVRRRGRRCEIDIDHGRPCYVHAVVEPARLLG